MEIQALLEIERGFWLEGADYYDRHIADEAVFVFPGMVLDKAHGVAAADQAPRWEAVEITDARLVEASDDAVVLTYRATGRRRGSEPYTGRISTLYRLAEGEPKMLFHQQTPDTR